MKYEFISQSPAFHRPEIQSVCRRGALLSGFPADGIA
jgi:hypothetical protein